MSAKELPIVTQPTVAPVQEDDEPTFPPYKGPAFLSYGFRPFFLGAALFTGLAILAWVALFAGRVSMDFLYPPREWHVHEMLFGYLPALIAGFLLTAMPNWTDRMPLRGTPLLLLFLLWFGGRLLMVFPWAGATTAAVIDGAFLVILAVYVWREIIAARTWDRAPIGVLVSLYACANILFHLSALRGSSTDSPERFALSVMTLMLTVIGGRLAPTFAREYLEGRKLSPLPEVFSRVDGIAIVLVLLGVVAWNLQPESLRAGSLLIVGGVASLIRWLRWGGWRTWQEPLVLILHIGYAWIGLFLVALGASILGVGFTPENAVHLLTTGAMGSMTLAVMTRASLGHTGRPRHADRLTVTIYLLINLGALLRIFAPNPDTPTAFTHAMLSLSAIGWSGAYLLFVFHYGPYLVRPSLDE
ncbi:MAG: NnrS family protein [Nitrospira sp.]|nr:NnrS family protein [Nitrospira sp.]MDH4243405.1 NnrS family protein [Nitrospira sp.]MDH4355775.1 NnrS family protein [Nitrospira sp.]MDH5318008.1 NnrS family protein [Nitrospira sp.]